MLVKRFLQLSKNFRFWHRTFSTASNGPESRFSLFSTAPASQISADNVQISQTPFSQPIKNLPNVTFSNPEGSESFETQLTTLPNGLRVASESKFGEFCTVGVVIDAGSRYEVGYPSGICHFLQKLAFQSTTNLDSRDNFFSILEQNGGICDSQYSKDTFIYASSCHIDGLDTVLGLIADAVLRPSITEEEFNIARETVAFEIESLNMTPECEPLLTDWIHMAAYRDNTLGLPKICPQESLEKITPDLLLSFLKTHFAPERLIVAGVGASHDQMLASVKKHFVDRKPIWETDSRIASLKSEPLDNSKSQWTGGIKKVEKDLSSISLGPTPYPELAHFVLGLEGSGYKNEEDFVPFCVFNSLMGGGGSFSAGGPGKGMYTRLYTQVLNRYHWMYNATSYNHSYTDSGLFCISASANPSNLSDLVTIITDQFLRMATECEKQELDRAKIQLKSMLLMNLEQRPVMFEDVGRQVLGYGRRRSPYEYMAQIDNVTVDDIKRVGAMLLESNPAVVGYGSLKKLPDYEKIHKALAKRNIKELSSKKFSFYYR